MDSWLRLLQAGAAGDRDACIEWSLKLGYLTGEENEVHSCLDDDEYYLLKTMRI